MDKSGIFDFDSSEEQMTQRAITSQKSGQNLKHISTWIAARAVPIFFHVIDKVLNNTHN